MSTIRRKPDRCVGSGYHGIPQTALGLRIRQWRSDAGLGQAEFAKLVGTAANRVSDWELGITEPTLPLLKRIADAFDVTVSQLLDGVM